MTEDLERRLRLAAHEMKAEDRFGWAAVCEVAAEALSTSRARVEVLEKALEPFAGIADIEDEVGRDDTDDDRVWISQAYGCRLAELTVEDFRRVRAALYPRKE